MGMISLAAGSSGSQQLIWLSTRAVSDDWLAGAACPVLLAWCLESQAFGVADSAGDQRVNWPVVLKIPPLAYVPGGRRDLRLDFLRGFCALAMIIDHVGGASW